MPTIREVLSDATARLKAITETPRLDAEILLAHTLGLTRAQLLARMGETVEADAFAPLLARRLNYEPIAYILGEWEFFSLDFEVRPPVLVPRPETEHLVEVVLEFIGDGPARVLDVGVGSGCVAVAIAVSAPKAHVVGTDIKPEFLALAQRNARRHGIADRVELRMSRLFDELEGESFDVICSNPPYIAEPDWEGLSPVIRNYEDPDSLLAGPDGLAVIRPLIAGAKDRLRPGGLLAIEIGMGQYDAVRELMAHHGYAGVGARKDLAGVDRIAYGTKPA